MRISSIDIGSNAIRQLIVEVDSIGGWTVLKKHREPIRLGDDVFLYKNIMLPTQRRLVLAFKRMSRLNKKFKVEKSIALATSAFRDAQNKKAILTEIKQTSGISIDVISGKKEAQLIRTAVQNSICLNNEHCLLIDIGGGSVELTHLQNNKIFFSQSFKWGMVRTLMESQSLHKSAAVILKAKLKSANAELPKRHFDLAIGTGGNLDAIGKLKLTLLKKGPNTLVTYGELKLIYKKFLKTKPADRIKKLDLKPDRVDVIEPAIFLTLFLMKKYKIKRIKIPGVGLKEGAIFSFVI
jgi:exopolyphosphatase/guanosine-5'-triphosphate,3'-diphosphate pyrophosphatase